MNKRQFIHICYLTAALIMVAGCTATKQTTDPLEGWKQLGSAYRTNCPFSQAIVDDYQKYIQNLPANENSSIAQSGIRYYESASGRCAVKISTAVRGSLWNVRWDHVLIYDGNNKRIRTEKIKVGRSLS
jgi:hypothetical protein